MSVCGTVWMTLTCYAFSRHCLCSSLWYCYHIHSDAVRKIQKLKFKSQNCNLKLKSYVNWLFTFALKFCILTFAFWILCTASKNRNPIICRNYSMRNITKNHPSVGILTNWPSAAPFGYALGPTNPWLNTIAKETLDFQCLWLSHRLRLLRPTFSLLSAPQSVTLLLHCG